MAAIIGHILPLGVGVALSSVPIVVMVLILLSPKGRWSGLAYLIGAVIGLVGLTALFTAIASLLPPAPAAEQSPLFASIEIVLGIALLVLAALRWRRRVVARRRSRFESTTGTAPAAGPGATAPTGVAKWMERVTTLGPIPSLGVGFVLMLRPKNLLLTITAGVAIAAGGADLGGTIVAIAIFVVLGLSTVAAPIIYSIVDPARMRKPLEETRVWIEGNSSTVTTIVLLVLGTVIIGSGLARF